MEVAALIIIVTFVAIALIAWVAAEIYFKWKNHD